MKLIQSNQIWIWNYSLGEEREWYWSALISQAPHSPPLPQPPPSEGWAPPSHSSSAFASTLSAELWKARTPPAPGHGCKGSTVHFNRPEISLDSVRFHQLWKKMLSPLWSAARRSRRPRRSLEEPGWSRGSAGTFQPRSTGLSPLVKLTAPEPNTSASPHPCRCPGTHQQAPSKFLSF